MGQLGRMFSLCIINRGIRAGFFVRNLRVAATGNRLVSLTFACVKKDYTRFANRQLANLFLNVRECWLFDSYHVQEFETLFKQKVERNNA